jgi:hypothetical protein
VTDRVQLSAEKDQFMYRSGKFAAVAVLLASVALPAIAAQPPAETAAQKSADHDFGKLSKDGHKAIQNIRMVRMDIFDGRINAAKSDIAKAMSSLDASQSDDTVFTKAESELKTPASMQGKSQSDAKPDTTPVAWVPVDGAMALDENYVATPDKADHVAKANEKLAKGDKKGAMDELKLANVDVSFIAEVAPLKATIAGVKQASDDLNDGKYFEANQALKAVQDGMRFDTDTMVATPQKAETATAKSHG